MSACVLLSSVLVRNPESRVSFSCIPIMSLHLRQPPKQRAAGPERDGRALGIPDPELNDDLTW
jgi:hypothetical protein